MLIGLVAVWACGSSETAPSPPPLATNAPPSTPRDAGANGEPDAFVLTPTPTSSTYAGTLATTSTVPFGGGGYCKYEMTLHDVVMEIEVLANGDVGRAIVHDRTMEKTLEGCPYPPMDPTMQDFTSKSAAVTTTGTRIDFIGAKTNQPETSLVVDLAQAGDGYEATATWKRVDQGPPLAWTITAKVSLVRK